MSNIVLSVENLYKQYRLGTVGTGTMRNDLARFWAKIRGKEDPNLKIGEVNNRNFMEGDYVWALQDINFEVKQGEILGIIGKNGAGKSTLLKILSKITSPTKGQVKIKGKIASLLEIGTGFHPELTGRENIFLNGAILGMTKNDIRSKFDEIVEFSGVSKYIDTPVKRYSSGMYVRLAFAVAAYLEPEILIIDEVLAVGDAEFQKKCLGKMKDVSGQGRTVLFVSHDMRAIKNLCQNIMLLKSGEICYNGNIENGISEYFSETNLNNENKYPIVFEEFVIKSFKIIQNSIEVSEILCNYEIYIYIDLSIFLNINNFRIGLKILNDASELILVSLIGDWDAELNSLKKGNYSLKLQIPNRYFNTGLFKFQLHASITPTKHFYLEELTTKNIQIYSSSDYNTAFPTERPFGYLTLNKMWEIQSY
ncbi:MAG: ABC transporter ATP-binding protein [Bacteroidetes bacterium]|nr:MAG: ABC transporter ATP-binding protein [Bacteroidota bacterium]TAG90497.1 MAG: ABC transporter ATP-binding protein [Bacteroidota bacterium]